MSSELIAGHHGNSWATSTWSEPFFIMPPTSPTDLEMRLGQQEKSTHHHLHSLPPTRPHLLQEGGEGGGDEGGGQFTQILLQNAGNVMDIGSGQALSSLQRDLRERYRSHSQTPME